jgi:hypothetical protein
MPRPTALAPGLTRRVGAALLRSQRCCAARPAPCAAAPAAQHLASRSSLAELPLLRRVQAPWTPCRGRRVLSTSVTLAAGGDAAAAAASPGGAGGFKRSGRILDLKARPVARLRAPSGARPRRCGVALAREP